MARPVSAPALFVARVGAWYAIGMLLILVAHVIGLLVAWVVR